MKETLFLKTMEICAMIFSKPFNAIFFKTFLYYAAAETNRSNTYILSKYTKLFSGVVLAIFEILFQNVMVLS